MSLTKEEKAAIIKTHAQSEADTGSSEVQVAVLTADIKKLTEHMKIHKKDVHSRRGLLMKVSRRNKLLTYLKKNKTDSYTALISSLGIRGVK